MNFSYIKDRPIQKRDERGEHFFCCGGVKEPTDDFGDVSHNIAGLTVVGDLSEGQHNNYISYRKMVLT